MERIKAMKEQLMSCVQGQMGNLANADAKELGEAVDMLKDLSEAEYYCSITKAMEKQEKEKERPRETYYYMDRMIPYRDIDRDYGRMYYGDSGSSSGYGGNQSSGNSQSGGRNYSYQEREYYPSNMRDMREGRSPMSRKMYMESKEMHHDKAKTMKELETYMQELSQDITEMIRDASPEEKQLLQKKIATLATKIE